MKTRFNRLRALYHSWRAVRLGQKSITHARKAAQFTPSPTGVEGLAVWFGYWGAWDTLAEQNLGQLRAFQQLALAQREKPKEQHVHTPEGEVKVLDWSESPSSQELLKRAVPAPTTDTKH